MQLLRHTLKHQPSMRAITGGVPLGAGDGGQQEFASLGGASPADIAAADAYVTALARAPPISCHVTLLSSILAAPAAGAYLQASASNWQCNLDLKLGRCSCIPCAGGYEAEPPVHRCRTSEWGSRYVKQLGDAIRSSQQQFRSE